MPRKLTLRERWNHRIPKANGGDNNQENLVAACTACNLGKGVDVLAAVEWRVVAPDYPRPDTCPQERHAGPLEERLTDGTWGLYCRACRYIVAFRMPA